MWLLGLLIGAGLGSLVNHVFLGALLGLAIGMLVGRKTRSITEAAPERDQGGRLQLLESRVGELERQIASLKARIQLLEGGPPETAVEPKIGAPEPVSAAPEPAALSLTEPAPTAESRPALEFPSAWDLPAESGEDPLSALGRRLLSGNVLAKIGVALLFFGVASALKLAAEHGWFPPPLRLLIGGAAGGAMIGFGWSRRGDPAHHAFNLILQGGGFGLLYLMAYFALAWYALIGPGFAFVLFALLGVGCAWLAVRQEGPMLAVFGLAGAFLAPILASSGGGSHIALFSYYLLLNGFILGVAWFRDWRQLTATGFLFTFLVGLAWAWSSYRPENYLSTQIFLILFFLLYSAAPVAFALRRAPGRNAWSEGLLLFGTPIAGIVLQTPLVDDFEYGAAWSAFLAGLYYFGLWRSVADRREAEFEILRTAQFGLGAGLVTLAVPLAFGAEATVAIWSVEGAASLWLALRLERPFGQWFGVLAQLGAGFWLLGHWPELAGPRPLLNGIFTGGLLVALSGLGSGALLRFARPGRNAPGAGLLLAWGLLWWYATGLHEIHEFARSDWRPGLSLLLFALTGLGGEYAGARSGWAAPRVAGGLVLPAAVAAVLFELDGGGEILRGPMALALPLAFLVHYWALARREADAVDAEWLAAWLHLGAAWLLTFLLAHDTYDLAARWKLGGLWQALALGLPAAGLLYLAAEGMRRGYWPFAARPTLYVHGFILPLSLLLSAWFVWTNLDEPGGALGRYIPLVDPLDLGLVAVLLTLRHARRLAGEPMVWPRWLALALALIGLAGLAARLAHHWGGVPFETDALMRSALWQALLSLLWTTFAIALMIRAARTFQRESWFAGFGLLAFVGAKLLLVDLGHSDTGAWTASLIGIALLVLAAGYFAPAPPKED